jgi:hypothetical protein
MKETSQAPKKAVSQFYHGQNQQLEHISRILHRETATGKSAPWLVQKSAAKVRCRAALRPTRWIMKGD